MDVATISGDVLLTLSTKMPLRVGEGCDESFAEFGDRRVRVHREITMTPFYQKSRTFVLPSIPKLGVDAHVVEVLVDQPTEVSGLVRSQLQFPIQGWQTNEAERISLDNTPLVLVDDDDVVNGYGCGLVHLDCPIELTNLVHSFPSRHFNILSRLKRKDEEEECDKMSHCYQSNRTGLPR
jgi:hypothetical protein